MSTDRLTQSLKEADEYAADNPALIPPDLAQRVWARATVRQRRRRAVRRYGTASAAVVLLAGLLRISSPVSTAPSRPGSLAPTPSTAEPAEVAAARAELARLSAEADSRIAVLRRTAALERRLARVQAAQAEADQPDALLRVQAELNEAAYVLLSQGDRLCHDLRLPAAAAESYRQVVNLFPDSPCAAQARGRLERIHECGEAL